MPQESRQIQLARRPSGVPTQQDFRLATVPIAEPQDGQVLVRSIYMSVDPYMRNRMNAVGTYADTWPLDQPMQGGAVGEVIASADAATPVGSLVRHGLGWRELALLRATEVEIVEPVPGLSLSHHLGVLGMPGLTAWAGLFEVAQFQPNDVVFVSGAAGAVGSLVGQFARLRGATRVVGSAGSDTKAAYLTDELGFDAAFNYRNAPVMEQLRQHAPDGIDVYFDNVGGDHLEAAIDSLRPFGRVALCGAVAAANAQQPVRGPSNLSLAVGRRLTLRGFLVGDHEGARPDFLQTVGDWLAAGQLVAPQTIFDGLENAVEAFRSIWTGSQPGKKIVRLDPTAA